MVLRRRRSCQSAGVSDGGAAGRGTRGVHRANGSHTASRTDRSANCARSAANGEEKRLLYGGTESRSLCGGTGRAGSDQIAGAGRSCARGNKTGDTRCAAGRRSRTGGAVEHSHRGAGATGDRAGRCSFSRDRAENRGGDRGQKCAGGRKAGGHKCGDRSGYSKPHFLRRGDFQRKGGRTAPPRGKFTPFRNGRLPRQKDRIIAQGRHVFRLPGGRNVDPAFRAGQSNRAVRGGVKPNGFFLRSRRKSSRIWRNVAKNCGKRHEIVSRESFCRG